MKLIDIFIEQTRAMARHHQNNQDSSANIQPLYSFSTAFVLFHSTPSR